MYFIEKLFEKLHIGVLNRTSSPSIKAGGSIIAGGDIVVGDIEKPKRAAVLNKGQNNTFINCNMNGPDYGLIDEGRGTKVIDCDIQGGDDNNFV